MAQALGTADWELAAEVRRQAAVVQDLEDHHRAVLDAHLVAARAALAAEVGPAQVWPQVLVLRQQLQSWCDETHPNVCGPVPGWSRWLVRRQLRRRVAGWEDAMRVLVQRDLTDAANRAQLVIALCGAPGGQAVASRWLHRLDDLEDEQVRRLDDLEDEQVRRLDGIAQVAQAQLQLVDRRAVEDVQRKRAAVEAEAQRRVAPAVAALRRAADVVREQGQALGYAVG